VGCDAHPGKGASVSWRESLIALTKASQKDHTKTPHPSRDGRQKGRLLQSNDGLLLKNKTKQNKTKQNKTKQHIKIQAMEEPLPASREAEYRVDGRPC
jgi:hypothetical protein